MKSSKLMLKAFTLSCLAVVSATGCREGGTTVSSEDRNIPVWKLYPESIEVPRSFVADIQAIQFVEVKSKVGGFIKEIHVDEGQEVKKGDVLFKLDAIEYYEAVREAEAALRQAEPNIR
jgi:membrane fusion protein (multidrug efflux system)